MFSAGDGPSARFIDGKGQVIPFPWHCSMFHPLDSLDPYHSHLSSSCQIRRLNQLSNQTHTDSVLCYNRINQRLCGRGTLSAFRPASSMDSNPSLSFLYLKCSSASHENRRPDGVVGVLGCGTATASHCMSTILACVRTTQPRVRGGREGGREGRRSGVQREKREEEAAEEDGAPGGLD